MTEDKVDTTLRKVIINLVPQRLYGMPVLEDECLKIDISDDIPDDELFCLHDIEVQRGKYSGTFHYIPWQDHESFKSAVENILDATIVNSKQRESIQKLLNAAFYTSIKFDAKL